MPLIIAIVLILIIGLKVAGDKAQTKQYEDKSANLSNTHDVWVARHVNHELESQLREFISNRDNYDAIREEVSPVLEKLEHWGNFSNLSLYDDLQGKSVQYTKAYRETIRHDRKVVLDILLANRGKVSSDSAVWGYKAYLSCENDTLKLSQFELVEWIKNTMNQQGYNVDLVYSGCGDSQVPKDCYYWIGTRNALPLVGETNTHRFKPFSKDLINNTSLSADT